MVIKVSYSKKVKSVKLGKTLYLILTRSKAKREMWF